MTSHIDYANDGIAYLTFTNIVQGRRNSLCVALATVRDHPDVLGDMFAGTGVPG